VNELDSLTLALEAERHVHRKDNAFFLDVLNRIYMWATPAGRDYDEDTALTEIRRICREVIQ